ncbi:iron-containing alcohol dehydrogenase [Desulforudis sp. 1088]|uniref:iron-containing alcohol dehydrogenase n=2 Tax=Candidatus Desulforudis TaxID=471826 RepID=UPI003CE4C615
MMFDILLPTRVLFGPGSTYRLGEEISRIGKRALVITGRRSLAESGQVERITNPLQIAKVETVWFRVDPEPTVDTVDEARRLIHEEKVDLVVGVGGGSALDVAKAAAGLAKVDTPAGTFFGAVPLNAPGLPWVAVPTTAGSGSEATKNAVLIDPERKRKASLRNEWWLPVVAVVDPILTMSQPPEVTAGTGFDALTHAVESFTSRWATPFTTALSREAVRLITQNIYTAYDTGRVRASREYMMLASLMAGIALANAGAGAVHALAHPVGVRYGIPHGVACGILLPYIVRFNLAVAHDAYADLAAASAMVPLTADKDEAARKFVVYLEKLRDKLGLPAKLSEAGLKEADITEIADEALLSRSLSANPRRVTRVDLLTILQENL